MYNLLSCVMCSCRRWVWITDRLAAGTPASASIRAGSAICTAGERWLHVGIVGSLPGREQKTDPTLSLPLAHEMWDDLLAPLLPDLIYLGSWHCDSMKQTLILFDVRRQWIFMAFHSSAFMLLFSCLQLRAIGVGSGTAEAFLVIIGPTPVLTWLRPAILLLTYVEILTKHRIPAEGFSVFHHFSYNLSFSLAEGLSLNLKLVFHPNCVKLLRYAVNNAGIGRQRSTETVPYVLGTTCMFLYGDTNL